MTGALRSGEASPEIINCVVDDPDRPEESDKIVRFETENLIGVSGFIVDSDWIEKQ